MLLVLASAEGFRQCASSLYTFTYLLLAGLPEEEVFSRASLRMMSAMS